MTNRKSWLSRNLTSRPLLFGQPHVKEIVRRPFFAKILDQSYVADPDTPPPQSEVDLIENWWARGGYSASGQDAIGRQAGHHRLGGFPSPTSEPIQFVLSHLARIYCSDDR